MDITQRFVTQNICLVPSTTYGMDMMWLYYLRPSILYITVSNCIHVLRCKSSSNTTLCAWASAKQGEVYRKTSGGHWIKGCFASDPHRSTISDIDFDILCGVLSDINIYIYTDILSDILSRNLTYVLTFYIAFYLAFLLTDFLTPSDFIQVVLSSSSFWRSL